MNEIGMPKCIVLRYQRLSRVFCRGAVSFCLPEKVLVDVCTPARSTLSNMTGRRDTRVPFSLKGTMVEKV